MSRKNKEVAEHKDEEKLELEEPSSPGNLCYQKLKLQRKKIRELREQLEEGLDTLAEVMDMARRG